METETMKRGITMPCNSKQKDKCPCTYSCPHHGKCCECVAYHAPHEFPACFFSKEGEATYDRSFRMLKKDREQ